METLTFDPTQARRYRKDSLVLAFRSDSPVTFSKSWGEQVLPAGSWIIVPLDGQTPKGDIYGCEQQVFTDTYEAVGPNTYRKSATIEAYQPGCAFTYATETVAGTEVKKGRGRTDDWFVRNPDGEVYRISDREFRRTYNEA